MFDLVPFINCISLFHYFEIQYLIFYKLRQKYEVTFEGKAYVFLFPFKIVLFTHFLQHLVHSIRKQLIFKKANNIDFKLRNLSSSLLVCY